MSKYSKVREKFLNIFNWKNIDHTLLLMIYGFSLIILTLLKFASFIGWGGFILLFVMVSVIGLIGLIDWFIYVFKNEEP